jgi:hypothetical protein
MPAPVTFHFGDAVYAFDLTKIAQLQDLQDKTGMGPQELFQRLVRGQWRVQELSETVRLALIGGGTKPADAAVIVERHLLSVPLVESVKIAVAALQMLLIGPVDAGGNAEGEASG